MGIFLLRMASLVWKQGEKVLKRVGEKRKFFWAEMEIVFFFKFLKNGNGYERFRGCFWF